MAINPQDHNENHAADYVTVVIDGQLFGLPIARVQDVFVPERLTRVPLAPPEVSGILNLRGRVVTAIDMRIRLGMGRRAEDAPVMAVGIEHRGESYGLLVDSVAEVMKLENDAHEASPINIDMRLARVSSGVFRLDGGILVVLDVDRILDLKTEAAAA